MYYYIKCVVNKLAFSSSDIIYNQYYYLLINKDFLILNIYMSIITETYIGTKRRCYSNENWRRSV